MYLTDEQLRDEILRYLDGDKSCRGPRYIAPAKCECCHYGLELGDDRIVTSPGWYTLWHPRRNILGLDFLHDVPDDILDRMRAVMFSALETWGGSFIPVSWNAFSRIHIDWESLRLVDRVGWECVYSANPRFSRETMYYISGYDHNELPPLYFLARLPHAVETYAEAIEALKPKSVKLAEKKRVKVLRQGDMFAIHTDYTDRRLTKMGAVFTHAPHRRHGLYGTAHFTTDMARLPDGTTFGRGEMVHRPLPPRTPDHAPLKLVPDSWFLIVKNTVPTTQGEGVNP